MIISGVVISSFTEVLFDLSGLVCALLSTMSTALLSVYAKKVSLWYILYCTICFQYIFYDQPFFLDVLNSTTITVQGGVFLKITLVTWDLLNETVTTMTSAYRITATIPKISSL